MVTGNHWTTSSDRACFLTDVDGFVFTGNIAKSCTYLVDIYGATKAGIIHGNVTISQTTTAGVHAFDSGVTAANRGTIHIGANVVNGNPFIDYPGKLATVTGIDAKATGTTTLYTVPTGKTAVITGAVVRCTAATAITVAPTLGIGVAAGEDDIFASTALTGLTATTKEWTFVASGLMVNAAAAAAIKVGIDTAATGTSQTLAIDLLGYLV